MIACGWLCCCLSVFAFGYAWCIWVWTCGLAVGCLTIGLVCCLGYYGAVWMRFVCGHDLCLVGDLIYAC